MNGFIFSRTFSLARQLSPLAPRQLPASCRSFVTNRGPPKVALIGSGPAGFYTAIRVLHFNPDAQIDIYESLPTPYGLVRYGVAPDHPEVRNCIEKFETLSENPRFNFIGNVQVGRDLALKDITSAYDSVVLAYGASYDKKLHIPGEENIKGVFSAREFVGWYNSLPECAHLDFMLDSTEDVIIIGNGNVAMDVARILLSDPNDLRKTDMADHALDALSKSAVKSVKIVGRRGVLQSAFTNKELRENLQLKTAKYLQSRSLKEIFPKYIDKLPRQQKRLLDLLRGGESRSHQTTYHGKKEWSLEYLFSPSRLNSGDDDRLNSVTFTKNRISNLYSVDAKVEKVEPEMTTNFKAQLLFRSIGYKSKPLAGMSDLNIAFDEQKGIVANDNARVLDTSGRRIPGLYCAGWVKRGPTGVIASTMIDAFDTATSMDADWISGKDFLGGEGGWNKLKNVVKANGGRPVEWKDWEKIQNAERERKKKFTSVEEMLEVLD